MPRKYRCVFGCDTRGVAVHDFPQPSKFPQQFKEWVTLAGVSLANLREEEIYRKKKVCHIHFSVNDMNRNNRLNALAIPSLHLPGTSIGHNKENTLSSLDINLTTSKSTQSSGTPVMVLAEHNYSCFGQKVEGDIMDTNVQSNLCLVTNKPSSTPKSAQSSGNPLIMLAEHNYSAIGQHVEVERMTKIAQSNLCLVTNQPSTSKSAQSSGNRKKSPILQMRFYKQAQRQVRNLQREIYRLRKRGSEFKARLDNAEKMTNSISFKKVTNNMTLPAKLFTSMQFKNTSKKPKGRRFSLQEKCLSLALFKRSPKCYALLHKCFTLPSARTLRNLLGQIKIGPGINKQVFDKIKATVSEMNPDDKLCSLIFDEMSLTPGLHFDASNDILKGFSSYGEPKIADHVLVFMIKGIKKKFKQPVAYYFTQNMKRNELKNIIIDVIKQIHATGLNIICTVCDQSTVNVSTMNSLIQDTKGLYYRRGKEWHYDFYEISKKKIVHLYDVPHLIKGIRNNLLSKDLKYFDSKEKSEKIIKWKYFQDLYEADKTYGELRCLQKITEEHVMPTKINKMRVKLATQIFSRSVAVATEHITARGDLASECRNLIPFVLLMDNLFDSLNVSCFKADSGKKYKNAVKRHSPHHLLWQEAIIFLKQIKYLARKKEGDKFRLVETVVPSVTNFIKTIEGMQSIWKILNEKYRFDSMLTRNFNQDPVENFFGNIRSLGVRNIAPNYVNFEGAYKTLLLNNYCTKHSIKSNCEEDYNTCLQSLEFLLNKKYANKCKHDVEVPNEINIISNLGRTENNTEGISQRNYVCGWVLKQCLKNIIKGCKTCKKIVLATNDSESNLYIKRKEFENKKWLCYPSDDLCNCFTEIQNTVTSFLKSNTCRNGIKKSIKILTDILVNYPFKCTKHIILKDFFEDKVINVIIFSWCRSVNRILSGQIIYDGEDDVMKVAAQQYYNKHRHNKNKK